MYNDTYIIYTHVCRINEISTSFPKRTVELRTTVSLWLFILMMSGIRCSKKNPWKKILNFKVKVNFVLQNWLYRFGGVESHYGGFYICLFYIDPVQMNFPVKTYQDIFMSLCYGSKHPLRLLRFYYCNIGTNTSRPLLNLRHISVLFRLWRMESLLPSLLVVFIETKEWSHPMYTYWNRYVLYSLLGYCTEYKMSH